jgi:aspartyl-tRNA(Asn)/glutamyl-tRNA(Gln) amidotransferase subunit B
MNWETVIGLEVHVQLATQSKMFCSCAAAFGELPNTLVCPVCLGLPGALPVPNRRAIRLGVRAAHALECSVHPVSVFARKNYFYPDLPKGYQISQFDRPLATAGKLVIESPDRGELTIGITRIHLEEDAGKSIHDRFPGLTAVDLNRSGVPLAEIVSEPDLRSPAEARAYLVALKQILVYAGISDCSMEQGSLRVDGNLSVRPLGTEILGVKTEVKNVNSFANVERALEAERNRQIDLLSSGGVVEQVTMLFDPTTGRGRPMRSKEQSHDYRYFPEPDLPPLVLTPEFIETERATLPELPRAKRERLAAQHGLGAYEAGVITADVALADYFEGVVAAGAEPRTTANWVMTEVMTGFNETGNLEVDPPRLARLIAMVSENAVSLQAAKKVFVALRTDPEDPEVIAKRLGLIQVRDTGALEAWVDEVLAAHPEEVARYRGGETKLLGFLVGQVMKRSRGKADPVGVQPVLRARLES